MKKHLLLALCGFTVPFALNGSAFSFGFESLDNITAIDWEGAPLSTFQLSGTTGVTEGNFALEVMKVKFWDFQIDFPDPAAFWSALSHEGIVYVDITSNEAAGNNGFWGLLDVAIQGDGVSWVQLSAIDIWDTNLTTIALNFGAAGLDLSNAGPDSATMYFAFNAENNTTHYIDNLVVIPEPSQTAGVIGLVALAGILYVRRRRNG